MINIRYCIKCKQPFDIDTSKELCPECRELNEVREDEQDNNYNNNI